MHREFKKERERRLSRQRKALCRKNETPDKRERRLSADRKRNALARKNETPEQRERRLSAARKSREKHRESRKERARRRAREKYALRRKNETPEQREQRLLHSRQRNVLRRKNETPEQREKRLDLRRRRALAKRNEKQEQDKGLLSALPLRQRKASSNRQKYSCRTKKIELPSLVECQESQNVFLFGTHIKTENELEAVNLDHLNAKEGEEVEQQQHSILVKEEVELVDGVSNDSDCKTGFELEVGNFDLFESQTDQEEYSLFCKEEEEE